MPTGVYERTKTHRKILSMAHKGEKSHFYKDGRCLQIYYCIDCGKELKDYHAKRCMVCSAKERANKLEYKEAISGKNCNFYIDGRTSKKYYCIDCGNIIGRRSNRCKSCSAKLKWRMPNSKIKERMKGENHPNWNGGNIEKYCIDCGAKISCQSVKRCNSCSSKTKWKDSKFKEKNKGNTGCKHTKETKGKMRLSNIANWQRGIYDGLLRPPTQPEKKIMCILKELNINYIFQYRPKKYSKIYDFYIPNINLLIEFDGIYWHNLPGAKEKDIEKTEYANTKGYNLLRFNEDNLNTFKDIILKTINKGEKL